MIFQIILVIALCVLAIYAYFQVRSAPAISAAVLLLALGGVVLAIAPDLATRISNAVGIGRGADLVIYCFIMISMVAIFNLHLRFRANEECLTRVVRALAILAVQKPDATAEPGVPTAPSLPRRDD